MVKPEGVTTQIKALDEFIVMVMFSFVTAEESIFLAIFYYWDSKQVTEVLQPRFFARGRRGT